MKTVVLGKSGLVATKPSLGCLPLQRCDKDYAVKLLRAAYDGGIRFYDTANAYTDSEEKIGLALSGVRSDIVIATKSAARDKAGVLAHIENSLRMMKTDYIDLFQFHQVPEVPDPEDPEGAYAGALEAKKRGWIGHIGVTTHRVKVAEECIDSGLFDPMMLRSFIQSGLKNEIDGFTRDLFGKLGDAVRLLLFRHYLIVSVRVNAIAALQSMGCDTHQLELPPMSLDKNDEHLRAYFSKVLEQALQIRDDESQKQNSSIIENALKYIDQNYSDESISLNVVAKAINISANYLSAVFSQKMGISFVEYLTQKRMEKAKYLLRNTAKRSGEIAYEVGYKDPRYFSFVFKKTQQCTPRDYRAGNKT